jgi:hypothetical protein
MENSLGKQKIKLRSDTCKRRNSIFFMGMMIMMFKLHKTQQNSRTENRRKKKSRIEISRTETNYRKEIKTQELKTYYKNKTRTKQNKLLTRLIDEMMKVREERREMKVRGRGIER